MFAKALVLAVPLLITAATAAPTRLHVSPAGDDSNPGTGDRPLATPNRAMEMMRGLRAADTLQAGAEIIVAPGDYCLPEPLVFTPADSGTETAPLVIRAAEGGRPALLGSRRVTGWEPFRDGIFRADLKATALAGKGFWQLYFRGKRQVLARFPNEDPAHPRSGGFLYMGDVAEKDSRTLLRYKPERLDPSRWANPKAARVHIWSWLNWNRNILPIASIDTENSVITLGGPASYKLIEGNRFFVENLLEELDTPGEWYLDRAENMLYFMPPEGEAPDDDVTVPVLDTLIQFRGDAAKDASVSHITVRGFTLAESQAGLVSMTAADHCTVAACDIKHSGGTAISLGSHCHHNRIIGCDVHHVGGSAVVINGRVDWEHRYEGQPNNNLISNNHVHHVGEYGDAWGAICIWPGCGGNSTYDNVISHNLVHDTPRQGITFNGMRNTVEYNHVHHTNQEQSDTGAIGMGSRDIYERGSVVRFNYVHDTGGYNMLKPGVWEYPHYCWGVYLDDYTSGVYVYGNIIVRTYLGGVMIHGGQDNVVENNIIVDGLSQQVQFMPIDSLTSGRTPAHPDKSMWLMTGNRMRRNVFYYSGEKSAWLRGSKWEQMLAESDHNLIWTHDKPITMNIPGVEDGDYWSAWKAMGYDRNSIVADPLFVDPAKDDYRLRPDSPAFDLGFVPIPVHMIGPYASPDRVTWPIVEAETREEHLRTPEGEPVAKPPRPTQILEARKLAARPTIDGKLDEWSWDGPGVIRIRELSMEDGNGSQPSRAVVATDGDALYVALENQVSNAAALKRTAGDWGADDGAEVCIQVIRDGKAGPVYVVQGYPSGKCQSVTNAGASDADAKTLGQAVEYAASIGDSAWSGEWRIPLAALGIEPAGKPSIRFNIGVLKGAQREWIAWVSAGGAPWHMDRAGVLQLP